LASAPKIDLYQEPLAKAMIDANLKLLGDPYEMGPFPAAEHRMGGGR